MAKSTKLEKQIDQIVNKFSKDLASELSRAVGEEVTKFFGELEKTGVLKNLVAEYDNNSKAETIPTSSN